MSVHEDIMKLVLNINTVTQSVKYGFVKNHRELVTKVTFPVLTPL